MIKYRDDLVHKDLSYMLVGLMFKTQKSLGRFRNEKQYGDYFEDLLKNNNIEYQREFRFEDKEKIRCIIDFMIDDKIIVEFKTKDYITKEDYFQTQRYLTSLNKQLGLLVNFRQNKLVPKRVLNSDFLKK